MSDGAACTHTGPVVARTSTAVSLLVRSSTRTQPSVSARSYTPSEPSASTATCHGPYGVQLKSISQVNWSKTSS